MARPPQRNRENIYDSIIAFRIAPGDRELLKQLVEYHAAQCAAIGTTSSESAVIRWLIREKAEVIRKAREPAMQESTEVKTAPPPSPNAPPEAPAPRKKTARKRSEKHASRSEIAKNKSAPTVDSEPSSEPSKEQLVIDALRVHEHPKLKLIPVYDVVRSLQKRMSIFEIHQELLRAADAQKIELRPERGSEFLSEENARLCPPGARGSVFSYARFLKDEVRA